MESLRSSPAWVDLAFTRSLLDDPAGLELVAATRPEPLVFLEGAPDYYRRFGFRPVGDLRAAVRDPGVRRAVSGATTAWGCALRAAGT